MVGIVGKKDESDDGRLQNSGKDESNRGERRRRRKERLKDWDSGKGEGEEED